MKFKRSLARRIVIAFTGMTVMVAGIFALGIVASVYMLEESLISSDLGGELDSLLRMESMEGWSLKPAPGQLFYFSGGQGDFAMPEDLAPYAAGFHEVFRGHSAYHMIVREVDGRRYFLLQDQSDFEAREQLLFMVVLSGFLLSSLLAAVIGWLLARRVLQPLARLAGQVRNREQMLTVTPQLAPDYAQDEVGELATAFDHALAQLRSALGRERMFTSDVSHELRTPLMVIASSCELLEAQPALPLQAQQQVRRIAKASADMKLLAEAFLLLARAEHGRPGTAARKSLRAVADELVEQWRETIEGKGLRFSYQANDAPAGEFDEVFLRTVLLNLLRNALYYTAHGSISLELNSGGFVVSDSGEGIPAEARSEVFESFVRHTTIEQGSGVGLSLVRRICAVQGWSIELSAVQPHGCRFAVGLQVP
ncbi:sensor histidine kinase [Pseudomonas sp. N040]|uniref:sensor histidine kinase n=1 Tax=Pseudomonas sp. N040 TaxID=2785325 RepID=UPI0018A320EB|nr:HAMP domain-containing sensor histidine kinase [Pseudomonas sp. N040]MBF7730369.1 HAMP domain-containing histidine kinase [Pseudomonas sp. N040]MBW7014011.1 HAMP domain-containing histidine kinase [Pseudomonas sp. N040]